jgi:hypothetical protein
MTPPIPRKLRNSISYTHNNYIYISFYKLILSLPLLLFLSGHSTFSQSRAQTRNLEYDISATAGGGFNESLPFWQYANTRGRYRPGSTSNGLIDSKIHLPFEWENGIDAHLSASLIGRLSDKKNTLHFLDLYGAVQYQGVRFSLGRFPDPIGLSTSSLSMGSMMVSRNAPAVPKIKLSTPSFLNLPLTGGHVQFRARWSDGVLGSQRAVPQPFLHQKTLYFKINVGAFSAVGGAVQNTIWGGEGQSNEIIDYLRLVSGSKSGTESDGNRVGNSIGAYDFSLQYASRDWTLQAYRLFYLEDTVSTRLRSPWDGLWGIKVQHTDGLGIFTDLLYEHMNTIQQDALKGAPRGRADYYDHFIYSSGWTYKNAVIGNPLITFSPEQDDVTNNMVIAHNIGIHGKPTPQIDYTLRLTYSRNYGICEDQIITGTCRVESDRPAPPNQEVRPRSTLREDRYSIGIQASYLLSEERGLKLMGETATDLGDFYEDRWGLRIGLRWEGAVSLN